MSMYEACTLHSTYQFDLVDVCDTVECPNEMHRSVLDRPLGPWPLYRTEQTGEECVYKTDLSDRELPPENNDELRGLAVLLHWDLGRGHEQLVYISSSDRTHQFSSILSRESLELLFLPLSERTAFASPAPYFCGDKACRSHLDAMYDRQHVVVVEHMCFAQHGGRHITHYGHDVHRDRLGVGIRRILAAARVEQCGNINSWQRLFNGI